ncbi:uncharacterized protein [Henckelia pumila]|uniref:uncharacterized protein n=1 Tax=Henckelia pumila TaxID=405737 RepID=UPI003C6E3DE8
MATSETMSTPNEWMQFYQTNYFSDHINQILPPSTAADSRSSNLTPNHGRISKPLRRRARASRRTPTTLFNTDTANFRSMVQRFTGAPVSRFAHASSQPPAAAAGLHAMNEAATAVINAPDPAAGFHMQYYSHHLLQQQQVFAMDRIQGGGGGGEVVSCHAPPGFSNTKDHRDYSNYMM